MQQNSHHSNLSYLPAPRYATHRMPPKLQHSQLISGASPSKRLFASVDGNLAAATFFRRLCLTAWRVEGHVLLETAFCWRPPGVGGFADHETLVIPQLRQTRWTGKLGVLQPLISGTVSPCRSTIAHLTHDRKLTEAEAIPAVSK